MVCDKWGGFVGHFVVVCKIGVGDREIASANASET